MTKVTQKTRRITPNLQMVSPVIVFAVLVLVRKCSPYRSHDHTDQNGQKGSPEAECTIIGDLVNCGREEQDGVQTLWHRRGS